MGDGVMVIVKRKDSRTDGGGSALFVSIVERGRTDSHGDAGLTPARAREIKQTALGADGNRGALIVYGIAEKIRSGIEFAQAGGPAASPAA
jgi:hypothetical protein